MIRPNANQTFATAPQPKTLNRTTRENASSDFFDRLPTWSTATFCQKVLGSCQKIVEHVENHRYHPAQSIFLHVNLRFGSFPTSHAPEFFRAHPSPFPRLRPFLKSSPTGCLDPFFVVVPRPSSTCIHFVRVRFVLFQEVCDDSSTSSSSWFYVN